MAFFSRKKPETGQVLLATVTLPVVDDEVLVILADREVAARVIDVRDNDLAVMLVEEPEEFSIEDPHAKIRWQERGGRRTLETTARLVGEEWEESKTIWVVDVGTPHRKDRRAYVRARIQARISVVKDADEEPVMVTSIDMSEIAIAFEADPGEEHGLEAGDEVRIAFDVDGELFSIGAAVLRVDGRRAVVTFPHAPGPTRDALRAHVLAATVRRS